MATVEQKIVSETKVVVTLSEEEAGDLRSLLGHGVHYSLVESGGRFKSLYEELCKANLYGKSDYAQVATVCD